MSKPASGSIDHILERQVKSWNMRDELARSGGEASRKALAHLKEGPWLSVSRQFGSRGLEIAEAAGRQLGWQVFDREIVTRIAEQTHSRETVLSRLDERVVAPFRDFIAHLIVPGRLDQSAQMQHLVHVVWGLARQGNAVLVGRGANWFLDEDSGLRVRVVAPIETRIGVVAERERVSAEAAKLRILADDHDRAEFIRYYFRRDIDDPMGYDLVINTERLHADVAAGLIVTALHDKLRDSA